MNQDLLTVIRAVAVAVPWGIFVGRAVYRWLTPPEHHDNEQERRP